MFLRYVEEVILAAADKPSINQKFGLDDYYIDEARLIGKCLLYQSQRGMFLKQILEQTDRLTYALPLKKNNHEIAMMLDKGNDKETIDDIVDLLIISNANRNSKQ